MSFIDYKLAEKTKERGIQFTLTPLNCFDLADIQFTPPSGRYVKLGGAGYDQT